MNLFKNNKPSGSLRRKTALTLALTCIMALFAAAGSISLAAAPTSVILKVKGPGIHHGARFCGKSKSVYVFHRGSMLTYKGLISPVSANHFPVTVKVERCVSRHFRRLPEFRFLGDRGTGLFKKVRRAPTPSSLHRVTYFSAVAVVGGRTSNKRYFGIRR